LNEVDDGPEAEKELAKEKSTDHPVLTREFTRETRKPDYYSFWVNTALLQKEPQTTKEALDCSEKEHWKGAMQNEMYSIYSNDVWDLVELPVNRKTLGSKWVFRKKTKVDGTIERFKAQLVAQGFSQKQGLDCDETFSPVIRFEMLCSLVVVAIQKCLKFHQLDITAAFLNGRLDEEVFRNQPEEFVVKGKEHFVCRLKQSLYGLKQSPRCMNSAFDDHLRSMGYAQSTNDLCMYISTKGEALIIGVYIDDFVIAAETSGRIE